MIREPSFLHVTASRKHRLVVGVVIVVRATLLHQLHISGLLLAFLGEASHRKDRHAQGKPERNDNTSNIVRARPSTTTTHDALRPTECTYTNPKTKGQVSVRADSAEILSDKDKFCQAVASFANLEDEDEKDLVKYP